MSLAEPSLLSPERFSQGLTYAEFKARADALAERFERSEQLLALDDETVHAFASLATGTSVLVLAEPWCRDVQDNLPVLARLAEASGEKLAIRVFPRDEHPDLRAEYRRPDGSDSLPVFVFFDESFKEIGRFVERPASVTTLRAQLKREAFARHPEWGSPDTPVSKLPDDVRPQVGDAIQAIREHTRTFANAEVQRELREIARRARSTSEAVLA